MAEPRDPRSVRLDDATTIIEALNEAAALEGGTPARIRFMLRRLQDLLDRDALAILRLFEALNTRSPPSLLRTFHVGPTARRDDTLESQQFVDRAEPVARLIQPRMAAEHRTPVTLVFSEDITDSAWQRTFGDDCLAPLGYVDFIIGGWAACLQHGITLSIYRAADDPLFTRDDRIRISLMLRALAPIVDRELFRARGALDELDLTDRQREILLLLLTGESEKEIAAQLHRSVHTVHTIIKQLYTQFGVSTRGKLMARFVDRTLLEP